VSQAFFVTGTDTEVGKTVAACALLALARRQGHTTLGLKPVAAGCDADGHNEDALALRAQSTVEVTYATTNPIALHDPIAPHIAAARAGLCLQTDAIAAHCRAQLTQADLVVIEGAGGWRVPLAETGPTLADVAVALGLPVILVVGMRLGCINHALLTAEAIARDGLQLAGWIANQPGLRMNCHDDNVATLTARLGAPLLGELGFLPGADPGQLAGSLSLHSLGFPDQG